MSKFFYPRKNNFKDICDFFDHAFNNFPSKIYCKYVDGDGIGIKTYDELRRNMQRYGGILEGFDMEKRHVALLGKTDFQWVSAYFAVIYYGFVFIPLDRLLPKEELLRQVDFADVDILVFGEEYSDTAEYITKKSGCCKDSLLLCENSGDFLLSVAKRRSFERDQLLEIVYTSGTTDLGKAVMLSHNNVLKTLMYGIQLVDQRPEDTVLSIMPNNHTYELTIGLLMPVYFGMTVAIYDNVVKKLMQNMRLFQPATMLVVPMLLDGIFKKINMELTRDEEKKRKFDAAVKLNRTLKKTGINLAPLLFKDIYEIFGGKIQYLICGGAFLREELIDFFDDIGIKILEGYGLTECAPIVSCNSKRYVKKGSLGKIGPYCDVKIVDGELWVKGENVMLGYYKNEEVTREVMDGPWFKTGDLGFVKNDFLYMNGRKKNLIILSNGENVNPEKIENVLEQMDLVDTAIVFAKQDTITAEIYPNYDFARKIGITDVRSELEKEVNKINIHFPMHMQVRRIMERKIPFKKTTTMKVKRCDSLLGNT